MAGEKTMKKAPIQNDDSPHFNDRGVTLYIAFGSWGKPGLHVSKLCVRVVLGFMSVAVLFKDLELWLGNVSSAMNRLKAERRESA